MARVDARGLPYRDWPDADKELWDRLTLSGDPFDAAGPLSHLRPASLKTLQNVYGFFLQHVRGIGLGLEELEPHERPSLDVLRSFLASLDGLAPRTKAGYFAAMYGVMHAASPDHDWTRLRAAKMNLERAAQKAGGLRDNSLIPAAPELLALGRDLEADGYGCDRVRDRVERIRDGLMVQFLAQYPLRRKNFAELEIGRTLRERGNHLIVCLPGSEVKNHRPLSMTLTSEMTDKLRAYIRDVRRLFPGGGDASSGRLWLRFTYGPWEKASIGKHISRLTERGLGQRTTPHLFRHAAATTVAISETADARIIRPLLGHARPETSEKYYIMAGQFEASRAFHKALKATLVKTDVER